MPRAAPPGSRASPSAAATPVRRGMGKGRGEGRRVRGRGVAPPPRLAPGGGGVAASGVCPSPRPALPATSLEVGPRVRRGCRGGAAPCASPPPHRPWRRPRPPLPGPRTPRGAGPPVASRGLCGATGGGFPVAGPLAPPRRLPRRRPWAGLPRPVVVGRPAALGPSRGRRAPPRAPPGLGALSRPRPHPPRLPAARVSPSGFSRPLDPPPPAGRQASRRSPCPLPSALGGGGWGEGCPGARARAGGPPHPRWLGERGRGRSGGAGPVRDGV